MGYALIYLVIHPLSDGHWALRSGLRLSCLLLTPYRYWPALLVGEALPNAYEVVSCLDAFGVAFVAIRCVPPVLLFMPIVWWCRSRLALFPAQRLIDIKIMMLCVVIVTIVWTGYSYLAISFVHTASFHATPIMALGYFIGNYIAILGTVPIALMVKLDSSFDRIEARWRQMLTSRLTTDIVLFALPSIAVLAFVSLHVEDDMKRIARMTMFLPVAWVTLNHGWRAAVIGGAVAIAGTCLITVSRPEPEILETQAFIAMAITCLLATGARISAQLRRETLKRWDDVNLRRLARRNLQASEYRRRQVSDALEYLAGSLYLTNSRLLQRLRRVLPSADVDAYSKEFTATHNRVAALAESLHPVAWRERGLPAALNETIARALDEAAVAYRCVISGRGFVRMSPIVLSAAYRSACEAVVQAATSLNCSRVHLALRAGETNGKRWLVVRVEGLLVDDRVAAAVMHAPERHRIAAKLGAGGLDAEQLRAQVRIFDGKLHERITNGRRRITMLLHDVPQDAEGSSETEPLRLWVH
jgi:glucose-6-phosphate-specific signal transduction histidine kinase